MLISSDYLQIIAMVCAGMSAFCAFLFVMDLFKFLKFEKEAAQAHESSKNLFETLPIFIKLALPFAKTFLPIVHSGILDRQVKNTHSLLEQAGYDQVINGERFVCAKLACLFAGVVFAVILTMGGNGPLGFVLIALLYFYPTAWLNRVKQSRHLSIQKALPNVLDLLTLSVEAGKDFLSAMRDILRRRKLDPLGEELRRTFQEIQLGKTRKDALRELTNRVQLADLTNVMNSIIQADEMGVSIGQVLRIQGDQLRQKRFQRAEKLANEAPVKILFPMVLFIFPAIFIILLGPIFTKIIASGI